LNLAYLVAPFIMGGVIGVKSLGLDASVMSTQQGLPFIRPHLSSSKYISTKWYHCLLREGWKWILVLRARHLSSSAGRHSCLGSCVILIGFCWCTCCSFFWGIDSFGWYNNLRTIIHKSQPNSLISLTFRSHHETFIGRSWYSCCSIPVPSGWLSNGTLRATTPGADQRW